MKYTARALPPGAIVGGDRGSPRQHLGFICCLKPARSAGDESFEPADDKITRRKRK